jgi:hypothetical protein
VILSFLTEFSIGFAEVKPCCTLKLASLTGPIELTVTDHWLPGLFLLVGVGLIRTIRKCCGGTTNNDSLNPEVSKSFD